MNWLESVVRFQSTFLGFLTSATTGLGMFHVSHGGKKKILCQRHVTNWTRRIIHIPKEWWIRMDKSLGTITENVEQQSAIESNIAPTGAMIRGRHSSLLSLSGWSTGLGFLGVVQSIPSCWVSFFFDVSIHLQIHFLARHDFKPVRKNWVSESFEHGCLRRLSANGTFSPQEHGCHLGTSHFLGFEHNQMPKKKTTQPIHGHDLEIINKNQWFLWWQSLSPSFFSFFGFTAVGVGSTCVGFSTTWTTSCFLGNLKAAAHLRNKVLKVKN